MKKKTIYFILICFVAIALGVGYYFLTTTSDKALETSSLRLVVVRSTGQSFGSAVIFDDDNDYYYALTNEHVIREATSVDALDYEQNVYRASVVARSEQRDLAVIRIAKENRLAILRFANEMNVNDPVKAVGYPSSIFSITDGVINAIDDVEDSLPIDVIVHTAVIDHGSSGGALVNEDNQIVGINYAGYFDEGNLLHSYAIPVEAIQNFLDAVIYD